MNAKMITCPAYKAGEYRTPWQGPNHVREDRIKAGEGLPCFRRTFSITAPVYGATISATALGIFEMYLNGERVGIKTREGTTYDELKPGVTDYRQRVYTYEYDLMPYLQTENTLVAVVAPGWWGGRIAFGTFHPAPLCFWAEMKLEYATGLDVITTDETWECTLAGPTLSADLYDGEYTDGGMAHPTDPYAPYVWNAATVYDGWNGKVEPLFGPPVRVRTDLERVPQSAVLWRDTVENGSDYGAIRPKMKRVGLGCEKVTLHKGDHLILDMGQNMVGRPRVTLTGEAGAHIHFLFAEMLNDSGSKTRGNDGPEGSLYVANYRSAYAICEYVVAGRGTPETYTPLYSFWGYRYVELMVTGTVEVVAVAGEVLTSCIKEVSDITTSNGEINKFISNVKWGRRSNYLFIPTDCPQRDERLGWTADTYIFCGTAAYLCDVGPFMQKWMVDARDSQEALDGAYADVIPHVLDSGFKASAGWGEAPILIPDVLNRMYGDTQTIREHFPDMERYIAYLLEHCGYDGGRTAYGDWLCYEVTDKRYVAICCFAGAVQQMEKYARLLSEGNDDVYAQKAAYYHTLNEQIKAHFASKYVMDSDLVVKTQTAYLLVVKHHMVDGDLYKRCKEALCQKIIGNDYTLSTGFIGTGILANTLSQIGRDDLVYSLLMQTKDPSWLYSVRQGATTVWERWNSYTLEKGFGDVSMNSFNHYAYGAVVEWMYAVAAGIRPGEEGGFDQMILAPVPDTRRGSDLPTGQTPLTSISAYYESHAGRIESAWHYEGDTFVWKCTIPKGTVATIRFPLLTRGAYDTSRTTLCINGVTYTFGELLAAKRGNAVEFELPGGTYEMR